jgi:uncharacterized membrane protein (DUF106 family)
VGRSEEENKKSNPKLKTLNSKQTQMLKTQNLMAKKYSAHLLKSRNWILSFVFWICLGFRV